MSKKPDLRVVDTNAVFNVAPADESTVWHINGHDLALDMQDVDVLERYERAFEIMAEDERNIPKEGKSSVILRAYCKMFRDLFNNIFGDGADKLIFGDQNNSRVMIEVYENFLDFASSQGKSATEVRNRIQSRYSPNRAARRAANRK